MAYINSIQQVSISLGAGVTSNTATISAVGANAFIVWGGFTTSEALTSLNLDEYPKLVLTNTTTVTASRNVATTGTGIVKGVVIDPTANLVTKVQAGTITLTATTSNTATITSVDTTLSAVFFLGNSTTGTTTARSLCSVTLTNATTVTANCGAAIANNIVSYVVVTFNASVINRIQQIVNTSTANTNDDSVVITSVVLGNSMLAYGGYTSTTSGTAPQSIRAQKLTDATHIDFLCNTANTNNRVDYATVIEFKPGVLKSVNRGSITVASATSATATISAVDTTQTFCGAFGQTTAAAIGSPNTFYHDITLTNATTVTAARDTADATTSLAYYEAIEFGTPVMPWTFEDEEE